MRSFSLGVHGDIAAVAGKFAGWVSKKSGLGSGGMIGGRVARSLDKNILRKAAKDKTAVLVTGTNGKSTTTRMVSAALSSLGDVATNERGDNMTDGVLTALLRKPQAEFAVLEVDELYLRSVSEQVTPDVFVLLNLSRDQLDRMGETASVEKHIRETLSKYPQAQVVANCDDPLIVSAAWDCRNVTWVAAGLSWFDDSTTFPRGGQSVVRENGSWYVPGTDYRRPDPQWYLDGDALCKAEKGSEKGVGVPTVLRRDLRLQVPGRANRGNAAQAVSAALLLGADFDTAVSAVGGVESVAGRYSVVSVNGREVRLLLAKNPAGWQEALTMIDSDAKSVVIAVNGQIADGTDLSWLWDVDFEGLRTKSAKIVACGERGADLAVRLDYAGIDSDLEGTPQVAVANCERGRVDLIANYTAFRDFKRQLEAGSGRKKEKEWG